MDHYLSSFNGDKSLREKVLDLAVFKKDFDNYMKGLIHYYDNAIDLQEKEEIRNQIFSCMKNKKAVSEHMFVDLKLDTKLFDEKHSKCSTKCKFTWITNRQSCEYCAQILGNVSDTQKIEHEIDILVRKIQEFMSFMNMKYVHEKPQDMCHWLSMNFRNDVIETTNKFPAKFSFEEKVDTFEAKKDEFLKLGSMKDRMNFIKSLNRRSIQYKFDQIKGDAYDNQLTDVTNIKRFLEENHPNLENLKQVTNFHFLDEFDGDESIKKYLLAGIAFKYCTKLNFPYAFVNDVVQNIKIEFILSLLKNKNKIYEIWNWIALGELTDSVTPQNIDDKKNKYIQNIQNLQSESNASTEISLVMYSLNESSSIKISREIESNYGFILFVYED